MRRLVRHTRVRERSTIFETPLTISGNPSVPSQKSERPKIGSDRSPGRIWSTGRSAIFSVVSANHRRFPPRPTRAHMPPTEIEPRLPRSDFADSVCELGQISGHFNSAVRIWKLTLMKLAEILGSKFDPNFGSSFVDSSLWTISRKLAEN